MNSAFLRGVIGVATVAIVFGVGTPKAEAVKPFYEGFVTKYVKKDSTDEKEKAFAVLVDKAKCNVCHEGTSKKNRNAYGKAVNTLLEKSDKDNAEKIAESLEKTAAMKVKADDPKAPTFGEMIKQGRLPCEGK
jgi:hypothetical protein